MPRTLIARWVVGLIALFVPLVAVLLVAAQVAAGAQVAPSLTLRIFAPGADDAVFSFTGDAGPFALRDGDVTSVAIAADATTVAVRAQDFPAGWGYAGATCTGGTPLWSSTGTHTDVAINRSADAATDCTITFEPTDAVQLTIATQVTGRANGQSLVYDFAPATDRATLRAGESMTVLVNPGRVFIIQNWSDEVDLIDITCDGAPVVNANIDDGVIAIDITAATTCTFVNESTLADGTPLSTLYPDQFGVPADEPNETAGADEADEADEVLGVIVEADAPAQADATTAATTTSAAPNAALAVTGRASTSATTLAIALMAFGATAVVISRRQR